MSVTMLYKPHGTYRGFLIRDTTIKFWNSDRGGKKVEPECGKRWGLWRVLDMYGRL